MICNLSKWADKLKVFFFSGLIPAMIFGGPFDPILINVQKKDSKTIIIITQKQ